MDVVVTGRNVDVPAHYRRHVADKLARVERYASTVVRYEVELYHEPNPRQAKVCQRVEITGRGKGATVRAEASAADFYGALDAALGKLEARLRRSHDRRRVHHGRHQPSSVAEATAPLAAFPDSADGGRLATGLLDPDAPEPTDDGPGRIVREKTHRAEPMTVDAALEEMELVGHDFYLFVDAATGRPSVVYRRKGFDYGVIALG